MEERTAGLVIEAVLGSRVADVADRLADDLRDVHVGPSGDLARDERGPGRHEGLASHATVRVVREDGVEDPVGDLVGDLVGVAFCDRLGREESVRKRHVSFPP
jgi:hypothetical protein